MKTILPFFIVVFLLSHNCLNGQDHTDCTDPYIPCGQSPILFDPLLGYGLDELINTDYCLTEELNSIWIELNVREWGFLTFVISSVGPAQDMDFMVFEIEDNDCDNMTLIRCMASGESSGSPSTACIGDTGLAVGENDIEEGVGCDPGDNNFLAPVDVDTGDQLMLLVIDWSQSGEPFSIDFGGSARLDCIDFTSSINESKIDPNGLSVYFSNQTNELVLDVLEQELAGANLEVYDLVGNKVYSEGQLILGAQTIDLSMLQNGNYFYTIQKSNRSYSDCLVKLR